MRARRCSPFGPLPLLAAVAFVGLPLADLAAQGAPDPASYAGLEWRHIGPEGNRFSAAVGIAGDIAT